MKQKEKIIESRLWKSSVWKWVDAIEVAKKKEFNISYFVNNIQTPCGFCDSYDCHIGFNVCPLFDKCCGTILSELQASIRHNNYEHIELLCRGMLDAILRNEF